ncbi:DUF5103 domain-containing protein [Christiangramia salexigens]|uniref:DUF5103 domain-containing protein n=1 Tax=Christiangramia salexigens TaxID=1913577 RepID=A0A1L3J530_9FLAO|nr:DUF5103 domain-containing protein [Christiangramia salexigens]APG60212.1 DUF5103 domain-containing protein [Christiangramia salexigens]
MKDYLYILCLLLSFHICMAQTLEETPPPNYIRTVILSSGSLENTGNPIIRLGERLNLSFDDIIGDEADYYYTIQHYNYDWTPSKLSKNEYLNGFDDVRISNYQNAYNTLQPYTHYELTIPNTNVQGLKVSGNYVINVFNANRELVFSRKFMVYEPIAQIEAEVKRSRDLKFIDERQVVNFSINSPELLLKNPGENVKVSLIQNGNLKSAITNIKPQFTIGNELIYRYNNETSFWGGNEYFQFDNKDLRATTADISSVELNKLYHHFLFPDFTRSDNPYTYNPDINGGFVVRNLLGQNSNIEAEYVWVHFKLKNFDDIGNGKIHLYGGFNNFEINESTSLKYNEESGYYETARLFKQGYYNYKYVLVNNEGELLDGFISGNFDETENAYSILVYYRNPGARYDRLIGAGYTNSRNIRN